MSIEESRVILMKVIDVFYSESKNISCISVRYRGIKAGQKITDENGNLYEVYGLNTNGRALLNGITQLLIQGKFEGSTVTLL